MPIYAYRCESCGHAMDVLRKVSDPALTKCPVCGADALRKQVTAAGFQLKGSGWYVTDFKGAPQTSAAPAGSGSKSDPAPGAQGKPAEAAPASASGAAAKPGAKTAPAASPAAAAPAPASANKSASDSASKSGQ